MHETSIDILARELRLWDVVNLRRLKSDSIDDFEPTPSVSQQVSNRHDMTCERLLSLAFFSSSFRPEEFRRDVCNSRGSSKILCD